LPPIHLGGESFALEAEGAKAEPLVLRHFLDGDLLGGGGGLVLAHEVFEKTSEFLGVFAGNESGVGREAVGRMIEISCNLPFGCHNGALLPGGDGDFGVFSPSL